MTWSSMAHHLSIAANIGGAGAIAIGGIAAYGALYPSDVIPLPGTPVGAASDVLLTAPALALFGSILAIVVGALSVVFRLLLAAKDTQLQQQNTRLAVMDADLQAVNTRITELLQGTLRQVTDGMRRLEEAVDGNTNAQRAAIVQQGDDHKRFYDVLLSTGWARDRLPDSRTRSTDTPSAGD